jgi:septum site-determining protein MinC
VDIAKLLDSVRMRPIGVVADSAQHAWANDAGLPLLDARDPRGSGKTNGGNGEEAGKEAGKDAGDEAKAPAQAAQGTTPAPAAPMQLQLQMPIGEPEAPAAAAEAMRNGVSPQTMVIDKPLRSGQRIYAKGDLVVLGMVSNGAEVIAEGNIHIYAPLRGRALAGVHGNHDARIFCTCLEPELISIAGIYRTAENPLPADVHGKPAQIWLDEEKLMIETLRLT